MSGLADDKGNTNTNSISSRSSSASQLPYPFPLRFCLSYSYNYNYNRTALNNSIIQKVRPNEHRQWQAGSLQFSVL